ncbi:unnamed protein product [marine sediment metagenome]|uniref:Uncharacterized protein n=1 Tax=marine sediment metagenome TaxID=412755 RepID=X1FN96_9ZZZZ
MYVIANKDGMLQLTAKIQFAIRLALMVIVQALIIVIVGFQLIGKDHFAISLFA